VRAFFVPGQGFGVPYMRLELHMHITSFNNRYLLWETNAVLNRWLSERFEGITSSSLNKSVIDCIVNHCELLLLLQLPMVEKKNRHSPFVAVAARYGIPYASNRLARTGGLSLCQDQCVAILQLRFLIAALLADGRRGIEGGVQADAS
jgi:hypothetical protein